jgi:kinesin family protein 6/9
VYTNFTFNHYALTLQLIEQLRVRNGMQQLASGEDVGEGGGGGGEADAEEAQLKALIETEKASYRENFQTLKSFKGEIEHLQALLERSRRKLHKEFDSFWTERQRQSQSQSQSSERERERVVSSGRSSAASNTPTPSPPPPPPATGTTGSDEVDADIAAFYRKRDEMMRRSSLTGASSSI